MPDINLENVTIKPISNWDELDKVRRRFDDYEHKGKWVYRGQESADWKLESTFERAKTNVGDRKPWEYEAAILREFTRRAHHYIPDLPKSSDVLEWFSLMRHYGAPCRLLDFTYSLYVAAYFALKKATGENKTAAIWAINLSWLKEKFGRAFPNENREGDFRFKKPQDFYEHFLDFENPHDFVAPVNPFRMNQKLTAQQGIFLCPGNIENSFMDNLISDSEGMDENIVKIPLSTSIKSDVIKHLWYMNMNSATLFPDLAGFADYLSDMFYLPLDFIQKDLIDAIQGRFPSEE